MDIGTQRILVNAVDHGGQERTIWVDKAHIAGIRRNHGAEGSAIELRKDGVVDHIAVRQSMEQLADMIKGVPSEAMREAWIADITVRRIAALKREQADRVDRLTRQDISRTAEYNLAMVKQAEYLNSAAKAIDSNALEIQQRDWKERLLVRVRDAFLHATFRRTPDEDRTETLLFQHQGIMTLQESITERFQREMLANATTREVSNEKLATLLQPDVLRAEAESLLESHLRVAGRRAHASFRLSADGNHMIVRYSANGPAANPYGADFANAATGAKSPVPQTGGPDQARAETVKPLLAMTEPPPVRTRLPGPI